MIAHAAQVQGGNDHGGLQHHFRNAALRNIGVGVPDQGPYCRGRSRSIDDVLLQPRLKQERAPASSAGAHRTGRRQLIRRLVRHFPRLGYDLFLRPRCIYCVLAEAAMLVLDYIDTIRDPTLWPCRANPDGINH